MNENYRDYSYTSNVPCPSISKVTPINLWAAWTTSFSSYYIILLFSSLLFISPCRKHWLPNFLWYQASRNSIQTWLPWTSLFFWGGGCIPSLGTRKHLIACNLELVQVHRNTWAVSWACNLHLLGGSHGENWGCKYLVVHIHHEPLKPWKIKVLAT